MPRAEKGLRLFAPGEFRPGKSWYARGTYLGVSVQRSLGPHRTKTGAERALRRLEREIEDGFVKRRAPAQPEAEPTFADAVVLYLKDCPDSQVPYVNRLLHHYAEKPLSEFDQQVLDDGAAEVHPGAAPATVNRNWLGPAAAILHRAARAKMMPWLRVEKRKEPKGRNRWITPERFMDLVDAMPVHKDRFPAAMAIVMVTTRARITEAIQLIWEEHIDLAGSMVTLTETKNGNTYVRPLPTAAVTALANLPHRKGRVFGYRDRWQFYGDWKTACAAIGLTDFTPHDLGHCFATWHRQKGVDLRKLMELGGWEDIKSVVRYSHVATPENRAAAEALLPAKKGRRRTQKRQIAGNRAGKGR